jgi:urease accessory protein
MPFFNKATGKFDEKKIEEVTVDRQDAMRGRLRTKTTEGNDFIINLPRGETIEQGDIFGPSEKGLYYKIMIQPEPTIKVSLTKRKGQNSIENAVKLGYNLGNRHLEVLIEKDEVFVPITVGEEKVRRIIELMNLPLKCETVQKVITTSSDGYHPGEHTEE